MRPILLVYYTYSNTFILELLDVTNRILENLVLGNFPVISLHSGGFQMVGGGHPTVRYWK